MQKQIRKLDRPNKQSNIKLKHSEWQADKAAVYCDAVITFAESITAVLLLPECQDKKLHKRLQINDLLKKTVYRQA